MGAFARFAAVCILGALGLMPQGAATASELIILTNQGATPGVRELAAAFARAGTTASARGRVAKIWNWRP